LRCSYILNQCVTQTWYDEKPCGLQVRPKVQLPTLSQLTELSSTFGPASLIYIFKSLCYMMLQVSFFRSFITCNSKVIKAECLAEMMPTSSSGLDGSQPAHTVGPPVCCFCPMLLCFTTASWRSSAAIFGPMIEAHAELPIANHGGHIIQQYMATMIG